MRSGQAEDQHRKGSPRPLSFRALSSVTFQPEILKWAKARDSMGELVLLEGGFVSTAKENGKSQADRHSRHLTACLVLVSTSVFVVSGGNSLSTLFHGHPFCLYCQLI